MRDETKSKMNDIKVKAQKPNKLQQMRAEAIEKSKQTNKKKEEERKEFNESFKEEVKKADIASGRIPEDVSNDEWKVGGVDHKSKEFREEQRALTKMKRMHKKGHA